MAKKRLGYKRREAGDWSPLYEFIDCREDELQTLLVELGYAPEEHEKILKEIGMRAAAEGQEGDDGKG